MVDAMCCFGTSVASLTQLIFRVLNRCRGFSRLNSDNATCTHTHILITDIFYEAEYIRYDTKRLSVERIPGTNVVNAPQMCCLLAFRKRK